MLANRILVLSAGSMTAVPASRKYQCPAVSHLIWVTKDEVVAPCLVSVMFWTLEVLIPEVQSSGGAHTISRCEKPGRQAPRLMYRIVVSPMLQVRFRKPGRQSLHCLFFCPGAKRDVFVQVCFILDLSL